MFEWLKERLGKKDDVLEFRDHVVGSESQIEKPLWQKDINYSQPSSMDRATSFDRSLDTAPNFARRNDLAPALDTSLDDEPPSINAMPRISRFSQSASGGSDDIRKLGDGLIFIREQLSAIKTQNEVINERLKNLERTLIPERY